MPIDHLMLKVKDWAKAKAYYSTALKPLGYEPVADWGTGGGFGVAGQPGNIYVKQGASTLVEDAVLISGINYLPNMTHATSSFISAMQIAANAVNCL